MCSNADQPLGQSTRLAQVGEFGNQFVADRLKNFRRVAAGQAVFDGNGKNQVLVFVDESGPGGFVAAQTLATQLLVRDRRDDSVRVVNRCSHRPWLAPRWRRYISSTFHKTYGSRTAGWKLAT